METYTQRMENALFQQWDKFDDYNEDYSSLIEKLNSEDSFRSFGDGLLCFLQKRQPELAAETAIKFIEGVCKKPVLPKVILQAPTPLKVGLKAVPAPRRVMTAESRCLRSLSPLNSLLNQHFHYKIFQYPLSFY